MPAEQICPEAHGLPQSPQFWLSVSVFTQVPLQSDRPVWQDTAHVPPEQTLPEGHSVPHLPQLSRSVCRFTHRPLHSVSPC